MPVEIKRIETRPTYEYEYECAFCGLRSHSRETCGMHEWTDHQKAKSTTRHETAWGVDLLFRHFAERDVFDSFVAAYCTVKPKWEDPGWYREYTFRDSCMGCDMGDAIGLEKVDDRECEDWVDDGMRQRAESLPLLFGLPSDHPNRFTRDGVQWRRRGRVLVDESITLNFASPADLELPDDAALVEAWKVWRADR